MSGVVGILNVGAGDTKLTFDKSNPAECIRSARIVTDMLRRGYALLVETGDGENRAYRRVERFDPERCEYIIADFDPITAEKADQAEKDNAENLGKTEGAAAKEKPAAKLALRGHPRKERSIPASSANAVAVARTAGG